MTGRSALTAATSTRGYFEHSDFMKEMARVGRLDEFVDQSEFKEALGTTSNSTTSDAPRRRWLRMAGTQPLLKSF
ncbi:MAG: hypothetical protein AAF683_01660 [Pseudomonadota bacterium]